MSEEKHVYDDIVELDNQLPRWWLWTLYLTIAFAIPYFLYYTLGSGPTLVEEYEKARNARELALLASGPKPRALDDDELARIADDPAQAKAGHALFAVRCVSCHGAASEGGIGPNLTDRFWIHGGKLSDIALVITQGVPDKGMPPWGPLLKPEEVHALVAYVRSVAGTNPANAKPPQGNPLP